MLISVQRIIARVMAVILGILAIFSGGKADNIRLEMKSEVTTKTEVVEVEVLNFTGKKLTTDEQLFVEKNEDGEWVKQDFADGYLVRDIAIVINNLQAVTLKINVLDAFGKTLDEGEYRISKSFGEDVCAFVTFTVKAA